MGKNIGEQHHRLDENKPRKAAVSTRQQNCMEKVHRVRMSVRQIACQFCLITYSTNNSVTVLCGSVHCVGHESGTVQSFAVTDSEHEVSPC